MEELVASIICYITSIIIVLITLCLIFIYAKTKELHSYPCYFNILLSSVISLDNFLRLIPFYDHKGTTLSSESKGCQFQGFTLALLDKFMLTTMTIYSIISFLGLIKYDFYKKYEKIIFIILTITGFLISLIMAILFSLNGVVNYEDVCYVRYKRKNNEPELKVNKVVIDAIVTSILFVINLYCIIRLLIYIYLLIKESKKENNENKAKNYYFHFWKYFVDFLLTSSTFIMVILIILDAFFDDDELISLSYVFLSLLIVIFFTINSRVIKEGKKLILCKKEEEEKKTKIEEMDGVEDEIEDNDE